MATAPLPFAEAFTYAATPTYVPDGYAIQTDSLDTYIDLNSNLGSGSFADRIEVPFASPGTVGITSVTMNLLAARLDSVNTRLVWDIFDVPGDIDVGSQFDLTSSVVGTPVAYQRVFDEAYFAPGGQGEIDDFVSPSGMTFAEFITALQAFTPPYMTFFSNRFASAARVRLYFAELFITFGATTIPPRRLTGRDDSLALGTGRLYPRPSSRQAGRLTGYL